MPKTTLPRSAQRSGRRRALAVLVLATVVLGLAPPASAVPAATPRETWVTNGRVWAAKQVGGRIYLGGAFTQVGPNVGFGTAVDARTGARVVGPKVNGTVLAAVPDGSGGWYLGGRFTSVGGIGRNGAARVSSAGAVTSWNPNAKGAVTAIAVAKDGRSVFLGGDFTAVRGVARGRLAKVDPWGGSLDAAWNPGAGAPVHALAVSADGARVFVGGAFTAVGGVPRSRLVALDGSTGAIDPWDPAAGATVRALAAGTGAVFVGGDFTTVNGVARKNLAALDVATGALDERWNPSPDNEVRALVPSADGTAILIGGKFTKVGSAWRSRAAAVSVATGAPTAWNPRVSSWVYALATAGDRVYVGGLFSTVGGAPTKNLASVSATTGAVDPAWAPSPSSRVYSLDVSPDGSTLYVGGEFATIGGASRGGLASVATATGAPTAWAPAAGFPALSLDLSPDGTRLYAAAGGYLPAGNSLVAYDASTGATLWRRASDGDFQAVVASSTTVYAGGHFLVLHGPDVARKRLAAFDAATGALDPWAPNPATDLGVWSLALGTDGLVVGGDFTAIGNQVQQGIAVMPGVI